MQELAGGHRVHNLERTERLHDALNICELEQTVHANGLLIANVLAAALRMRLTSAASSAQVLQP